jgi:ABC-type cobalamin/Fe3+-siderophores transport system ATPase subunit
VIELLGVGVPRPAAGWLLHRVCATLEAGELTLVGSDDPAERAALLDAITGRRVPDEGRVWVSRVPLMPASRSRIRRLCGEVEPGAALAEHRSLFWNAVVPVSGPRALGRLLRLPRRGERQAVLAALERTGLRGRADEPVGRLSPFDRLRYLIARALARGPRHLVVRDPDAFVAAGDLGALLALLRLIARSERVGVVVSLAEAGPGRRFADRLLVLHEGVLVLHGRAGTLDDARAPWSAGALTR